MNRGLPFDEPHSYRARWLFPLGCVPIENGTVEITGSRISAIHNRHDPRARDLGNVAIIPGLVNAHAHLEFSDLEMPLGPADSFTSWIRAVVGHRRNRIGEGSQLVRQGFRECAAAGTTAIAEIATDDALPASLNQPSPAVCAFRECIGFMAGQIDEQVNIARRFLDAAASAPQADITRGISPHAPYSVHPELFMRLVELAGMRKAPIAIHLAETKDEIQFLNQGTGPFRELLEQFGVWQDGVIPQGSNPLFYLKRLEQLERALIVHGNFLSDEEIEFVAARPQLTVVYCPRTHAYFGHEVHPWQRILAQGGSVAVGTDSRASNPDLSLWRELSYLHSQFPQFASDELLRLGTAAGAEALNLNRDDWSLAAEQAANLTIVSLREASGSDPYELLFHPSSQPLTAMRGGRWYNDSLFDSAAQS